MTEPPAWFGPSGDGLALLLRFTLAGVRPLAMLALLPPLGGLALPWRARLAVASALAAFLCFAPGARPLTPADLPGELVAGLIAGLGVALAFGAAHIAGETVANMLGLGFAAMPGAGASVLGGLLTLLMWSAFLTADGPLWLLSGMAAAASAGEVMAASPGLVAAQGVMLFAGALQLALPVAGLLFLGQLLVAIALRAAPQLSAMALGPVALLLGFMTALPLLLPTLAARAQATLAAAMALI